MKTVLRRLPLNGNFTTFIPWCGSSVWLEYRPVTPGVAGSSPVRTAKYRPVTPGVAGSSPVRTAKRFGKLKQILEVQPLQGFFVYAGMAKYGILEQSGGGLNFGQCHNINRGKRIPCNPFAPPAYISQLFLRMVESELLLDSSSSTMLLFSE